MKSTVDIDKPVYACKIIDTASLSEIEMNRIFKEVKIHNLIRSEYAIRHY